MNNHGMNVCEFVNELKGISDDSVLHSISTVDATDYSILTQLDTARKGFDVLLGNDHGGVVTIEEAKLKRIYYNSLRKYAEPLNLIGANDSLAFNDAMILRDMDNHSITCFASCLNNSQFSTIMEANAINGFIHRNAAVQRDLPKHLLPLMRKFLSMALCGFDDVYTSSHGSFGNGAVAEGISFFDRWDQLGEAPYWDLSIEDLSPVRNQRAGEVRLCAVDKDWNKKRLITVEPYESTYLQHKIRRALSKTLVRNGLAKLASQADSHIDIPAIHRRVCLESSAHTGQTIKMDSIDLSDASDSISWDQIVSVFPIDVLAQLERARTDRFTTKVKQFDYREYNDDTNFFGTPLIYNKTGVLLLMEQYSHSCELTSSLNIYAGMGNATTFIVETLYFYALLQAIATYYRIPTQKSRAISVFGDDMLVPSGYEDLFLLSLGEAGLKVNREKTFMGSSPVRESCGMWAFRGVNLYVPPYRGYPETPKGQLGLAEYIRNAPFLLEDLCLQRVKDWPNTPRKMSNTISVADSSRCISWECSRYSSKLCGRQWFLRTAVSSHKFHLSVRRGGAYLMISRVPSQEGLSEIRPLIEVLNSLSEGSPSSLFGTYLDLTIHSVKAASRKGKLAYALYGGVKSTAYPNHVFIDRFLINIASHIMSMKKHVRGSSVTKTLMFIEKVLATPRKRRTEHLNEYIDELGRLCEGPRNIRGYLRLMTCRVHVLKEAIPYSVRLRSSWVSDT